MTSEAAREIIEGYEIIRKLGQGGMGGVYMARQKSMDRTVALKVLPKSLAKREGFKERFFREARAAGLLNHPNIVAAFDAQESNGYCYIAMEYVDGGALSERLKKEGALPESEVLSITYQIASALNHAWTADIVHRDVKPENFLFSGDGTVKLCDLGIAKAPADAGLTQEGTALGTPRYISPEQARGLAEVDWRADVYSLGASAYHMLCGSAPFDGPTAAAIMVKHIREPLDPLANRAPQVSQSTAAVVERMLAKNPSERYNKPNDLLADLEALMQGETPVHAALPRPRRRERTHSSTTGAVSATLPTDPAGRWALWLAAAAGVLLVIAIGVIIALLPAGDAPPAGDDDPPRGGVVASADVEAQRLFAEAAELQLGGQLDAAIKSFREVIDSSPGSPLAESAERRIALIEARIAAAEQSEHDAMVQRAAAALQALVGRKGELGEQEMIQALKQFRQEWDGTPSADQALTMARTMEDEIALREAEAAAAAEADPMAARIAAAKAALRGDDWEKVGKVLTVMRSAGPELRALVPEALHVAEVAPAAKLRLMALEAVAEADAAAAFQLAQSQFNDRNEEVRMRAVRYLVATGADGAKEALGRLAGTENDKAGDPSPMVRQTAREALADLP